VRRALQYRLEQFIAVRSALLAGVEEPVVAKLLSLT
jgi:hypothetical protein